MATKHLPPWGSQPLRSEGQNQKWPTSGQGGYITPTAYGFPSASERVGKIRSGPQVGHVATQPLPPWRSPPLQSGGQNQKWPTSRPHGYQTPAALWVPTASERGAKSEVAHKWARWLHNPCRPRGPHHFRAGGKIRSGPQVGQMATKHLPPWGSPTASKRGAETEVAQKWARWLHKPCRLGAAQRFGGHNQKWPRSGQGGYKTPAALGVPTASKRGAESEVANKWARRLHNPAPPPPGGSPPLQSGGQNQKWPTSGQGGYITPAA